MHFLFAIYFRAFIAVNFDENRNLPKSCNCVQKYCMEKNRGQQAKLFLANNFQRENSKYSTKLIYEDQEIFQFTQSVLKIIQNVTFDFLILAFFATFCTIKIDLFGNTV